MERKYASDYTTQEYITPGGGRQVRSVYVGQWFTHEAGKASIARLRRQLHIGCIDTAVLLLPLLFDNTRLGRTVYCILPAAFALLPLALLFLAARRLGTGQDPFTREHRDKTDGRIRTCTLWLTALLAASVLGIAALWLTKGFALKELPAAACLGLSLPVCAWLLTLRRKAGTVPAEKDAAN